MEAKIDALAADTRQIKEDLEVLKQIKALMEKMELIPGRMDNIEDEVHEISDEVAECKSEIAKCKEEIAELKAKGHARDQYDRINNMIIAGVPEFRNEKVRWIIKEIADKLGIDLLDGDIQAAHRLPAEEGEIPKIIAKFNNRDKKVEIIRASKSRKLDTSFMSRPLDGPATPVFCDDHLLPLNQWLLSQAKKMKKAKKLTYVWLRNCSVRVKVKEKSNTIVLRNEEQLQRLKREVGYEEPLNNSQTMQMVQMGVGAVATELDPVNNTITKKRTVDDRSPELATTQGAWNGGKLGGIAGGPSSAKAVFNGKYRANSSRNGRPFTRNNSISE